VSWEDLRSTCARSLQRPISDEEFQASLEKLGAVGDIALDGRRIRRLEPDFPESLLEDAVEPFLTGEWCRDTLRLDASALVTHRTARGGSRDTGLFSKPDFTLATVRRLKYDPLRHLDVITFELKNSAGATLMAVHEALAHTRFAHYSFLVCPRSRLRPAHNAELRDACAQHGLGLIMFDFVSPSEPPQLCNFRIELNPLRMTPDPYVVEEFLEARLPELTLEKLARIAGQT
jgi:hypothetical protein